MFPDFVAPLMSVAVLMFEGPSMVRRNLTFFLLLTWRCTFPALDIPGWQNLVSNFAIPVSEDLAEAIRSRPRYFGYAPVPVVVEYIVDIILMHPDRESIFQCDVQRVHDFPRASRQCIISI